MGGYFPPSIVPLPSPSTLKSQMQIKKLGMNPTTIYFQITYQQLQTASEGIKIS